MEDRRSRIALCDDAIFDPQFSILDSRFSILDSRFSILRLLNLKPQIPSRASASASSSVYGCSSRRERRKFSAFHTSKYFKYPKTTTSPAKFASLRNIG